jgi:hypothetical protein
MNLLPQLLDELAADAFTGRLTVRSVACGWVYLHEGRVYCAERRERPTLLVAMGEAGLFRADEWTAALRSPYVDGRWRTLAGGGDDARMAELGAFARRYVTCELRALARQGNADVTVVSRVAHPFGVAWSWPATELLDEATADAGCAPTSFLDRAEFLELLEEVSPSVRRVDGSVLSAVT